MSPAIVSAAMMIAVKRMDIFHRTFGMALKRRDGHLGKA